VIFTCCLRPLSLKLTTLFLYNKGGRLCTRPVLSEFYNRLPSLLPAPCSLLPAPCSLLPAPCPLTSPVQPSLPSKTGNRVVYNIKEQKEQCSFFVDNQEGPILQANENLRVFGLFFFLRHVLIFFPLTTFGELILIL
jgi:hypothetical protein